jgi:hypothetical protein
LTAFPRECKIECKKEWSWSQVSTRFQAIYPFLTELDFLTLFLTCPLYECSCWLPLSNMFPGLVDSALSDVAVDNVELYHGLERHNCVELVSTDTLEVRCPSLLGLD